MEFSIYRLNTNIATFNEILINEYGMLQKGNIVYNAAERLVNEVKYECAMEIRFYYKYVGDTVEIDWATFWQSFFEDSSEYEKKVDSAFGLVTILIEGRLYCVSMGRAFHFAQKVCSYDFGLDIAEMVLNNNSVEVKSAKFYRYSKNKELTQYNKKTYLAAEIGESDDFVIGNFVLEEKYNSFLLKTKIKKGKFGSAVKLDFSDITPREITEIIFELDILFREEYGNRQLNLPRIIFLKENQDNQYKICDLNSQLLKDIKNHEDVNITLSYFMEENGDINVKPFDEALVELIYDRKPYDVKFGIDEISVKLVEINCTDITKVTIRSKVNKDCRYLLIRLIDYITVYKSKNYCLYKGKWAMFNDSYLSHIENEIINVNKIVKIDDRFNVLDDRLKIGEKLIINDEKLDNTNYTEYKMNNYLCSAHKFMLLDRKRVHEVFKEVEFADLYEEESKTLIHVKIGGIKDMRYCIQQSLRSCQIYHRHPDALYIYGIKDINKISMLFVMNTHNLFDGEVANLGLSKSVYFKVEIIEWMNVVRSLGYEPEVIIAKDLREKLKKKV